MSAPIFDAEAAATEVARALVSTEIVQGITQERKVEIMRGAFRDQSPLRLSLNGFLIQRNGRLALVDAGGAAMNPGTTAMITATAAGTATGTWISAGGCGCRPVAVITTSAMGNSFLVSASR